MTDVTTVVDTYIQAWNATDANERQSLVSRTWADDGAAYIDPLASSEGQEGISGMIGAVQQQFAGHRFVLSAAPDQHNDRVRFSWQLFPPDGDKPVAGGTDFATIAEDGRLKVVTGFLDPVE